MDDIKKFEPLWGVWKTEALIGEGSYGKVYRAVREEFGRKYYAAVKHISIPTSESQITEAISEGIADDNESVKEYFEAIAQNLINEITLMNDVKGKTNIVSYEDHLIIPKSSGVGYDIIIRMELLTGLNDILRHKQLTNKDVIKLGIDLCSALEVCVEKGIVHRDIKPSNIFVSDSGDYKLGDFGVARELEHTTSAMSKKGTYIYMAPEVYRGESANFSADIFSLGIVMYRLLNGNRAPFLPVSAKIKPGDNENALARRMSGEQIPAPAFAEEGLAQIILKATQFDRTKRYASPTEMKNDLIRLSGGMVLERTIPIIAEPTHNSVSFQKRNAADNQGTVILFPEQEMSNPQVSNAARSNEAAYAPQMPEFSTVLCVNHKNANVEDKTDVVPIQSGAKNHRFNGIVAIISLVLVMSVCSLFYFINSGNTISNDEITEPSHETRLENSDGTTFSVSSGSEPLNLNEDSRDDTSSTTKRTNSTTQKTSSTTKRTNSTTQKTSSTTKRTNSTTQKTIAKTDRYEISTIRSEIANRISFSIGGGDRVDSVSWYTGESDLNTFSDNCLKKEIIARNNKAREQSYLNRDIEKEEDYLATHEDDVAAQERLRQLYEKRDTFNNQKFTYTLSFQKVESSDANSQYQDYIVIFSLNVTQK